MSFLGLSSNSTPNLNANTWVITVKSEALTLKTRIDPKWTISETIDVVKRKFPVGSGKFVLYAEKGADKHKQYVSFEDGIPISSFDEISNNCELLFLDSAQKVSCPVVKAKPKPQLSQSADTTPVSTPAPQEEEKKEAPVTVEKPPSPEPVQPPTPTVAPVGGEELYTQLVSICKSILLTGRNIKESITKQDEDSIFVEAKKTAETTVELVNLVFNDATLKASTQYNYVVDVSKNVRAKVLKFLQASRTCCANPFDFLSKQGFTNTSTEMVEVIKEFLKITETILAPPQEEPVTPEEEQMANQILKHMKDLTTALRSMAKAVEDGSSEALVTNAKPVVMSMNQLLQIQEQLQLDLYWKLKKATEYFINSGRLMLQTHDDVARNQYLESSNQMIDALNGFLLALHAKSKPIAQLLKKNQVEVLIYKLKTPESDGVAPTTPPPATKSTMRETDSRAYRFRKQAALRITHLLQSRFPDFQRQWMQQTPQQSAEVIELMVQEMSQPFVMEVPAEKEKEKEPERPERPTTRKAVRIKDSGNVPASPDKDNQEDETVTELQKLMTIRSAHDWQRMAKKVRRLSKKMSVASYKNSTKALQEELNEDPNLVNHFQKVQTLLGDIVTEFLFTINDTVLNNEENAQPVDEKSHQGLSETVQSFYGFLQRSVLLCRHYLMRKKATDAPPNPTPKKRGLKFWALKVETIDEKTKVSTKIKFDVDETIEEALVRIKEKLPIDASKEYGLSIQGSGLVLKRDARFCDYPQLASEKETLELKQINTEFYQQCKTVDSLFDAILSILETSPSKGEIQKGIIASLTDSNTGQAIGNYLSVKNSLEDSLRERVFLEGNGVKALMTHLQSDLRVLASKPEEINFNVLLQFCGTARQIVPTVVNILNAFETYFYLVYHCTDPTAKNSIDSSALFVAEDPRDFIWADETLPIMDRGKLLGGSLNHIITYLTSDENIDSQFLSTFISTYQSFATPWQVLQKLLQRYNVPEGRLPTDRITRIRLKITIVLKYWIENQFEDFDKKIIDHLYHFINEILPKDGHNEGAKLLIKELNKKTSELTAKKKSIVLEVTDWKFQDGGLSPSELFMALNESEIARQLTLIEFKMFQKIRPGELLNQAWNRPKLQHRAPNILAMISRSNKFSFWIASLILWFPRAEDRCKVLTKINAVADHLMQLHNYNTLIGVLAGMSMSAISRLKFTWNLLSPAAKDVFARLQHLFDPLAGFKNYRTELAQAGSKGAVLPYLGTYLSDLTFTEEGNLDYMQSNHNIINWSKREMMSKILQEIRLRQQSTFTFPVVEPINTFLTEVPFLEEKDLYDLSLVREPRGAIAKDIL